MNLHVAELLLACLPKHTPPGCLDPKLLAMPRMLKHKLKFVQKRIKTCLAMAEPIPYLGVKAPTAIFYIETVASRRECLANFNQS